MKIKTKEHSKKRTVIITISAVVLVIIFICGYIGVTWYTATPKDEPKNVQNTEEKAVSANNIEHSKEDTNKKEESTSSTESAKTKTVLSDRASPVKDESGALNFPTTTVVKKDENNVYISGIIEGLLVTDGECKFTIKGPSGEVTEYDAKILDSPSQKYCTTKKIALSSLKNGKYTVVTKYNFKEAKYEGISSEVPFQVQN